MVRYTPFPVVFSKTLLTLLVLVVSESILFLVRSLGHWVLSRLRDPKSISWGIVGLSVQRIPSDAVGILLGGDSFPTWGLPHSVLQLFVISHVPLLSIVTQRWICGCLGF